MAVTVNLRHLENDKKVLLEGEVSAAELDVLEVDEMIHPNAPLLYELEVERSGKNLLLTGELKMKLDCECVRCLKPFQHEVRLEAYQGVVPLEGEEAARVENDMVDLTPYLREDILLAFPHHPVCAAECDRLPSSQIREEPGGSAQGKESAWDELNKLKF